MTNEVGCEGLHYDESTESYKRLLGMLNNTIARRADCVCEVVCGFPLVRKGSLPQDTPETRTKGKLLVIGPENSGKRDFVRSLGYSEKDMSTDIYDDCPVLLDLHKAVMSCSSDPEDLMPFLLRKKVIICSEVGSGIIPVSPELTQARVQIGKQCNELAQQVDCVIRMICGIPTRLK